MTLVEPADARRLVAGKKQQKAEKHPKLLDFEELLLISSVPAQENALEKEHRAIDESLNGSAACMTG